MIMKILSTIVLLLTAVTLSAQPDAATCTGQTCTGQGSAIGFATVSFFSETDSSAVYGALADSTGRFSVRIPHGNYRMEIALLGYEKKQRGITIAHDTDLGRIVLDPSEISLQGVEVKAAPIVREADRFIVNVADMPQAIGRTAVEMLKLSPGVWIRDDIAIFGKKGAKVMINNRLLRETGEDLINYLNQIPAEDILRIEIVPNSGAEYDADMTAGIIKITLPYGTNLYQVAPKIETGSGCTVSPRSGQVVNLSLPVTYTLTRGDETRTYTVIVTLQKSASQLIWDKAAVKLNPSSYQTSPDLGKKDPEPTYIPSTSQILSGMKVQVNGKDVTYQASGVSNWLTMTPDSYSAASTYRFRAEKGALKNIAANGYNGFGVQAGKLMIGITEKMDTARGLDLSICPVPSAAQTVWKNKSGVVGVWKITCDSVSDGLTLTFDCAGQTGKLALAKYNEAKKCFEQVSEKKWSVSGSILTASNMSAGIYGVIKIG